MRNTMDIRIRSPSLLSYFRMAAYLTTIVMHGTNSYILLTSFRGDIMKDPKMQVFASFQDKFITCWTFAAQSGHAALGLSCELLTMLIGDKQENKFLQFMKHARDVLFASVVVPYTFMIPTVFWPIFLYNRELILPLYTSKVIGNLSNHVMHTAIIPMTLWEMYFQPRKTPASHKQNLTLMSGFAVIYLLVIFAVFFKTGVFPYPLMTMMFGSAYFIVFMVLVLMWLPIYYFGQWHVTEAIRSLEEKKIH